MSSHFINNIRISNYKCFNEFEVTNLKRVNLIAGKNNSGKTSFMEACFLLSNSFNTFKLDSSYTPRKGASKIDREIFHFEIIKLLILIKQNRDISNFLLEWLLEEFNLSSFESFKIEINEKFKLTLDDNILTPEHFCTEAWGNWGSINITKFREHNNYNKIYKKNHKPQLNNYNFSSVCNIDNIKDMIDELKLNEKYDLINKNLKKTFNIEQVDIIRDKIMLKQNGKFKNLSEFGDGLKHFINILIILFSHKNSVIYFDELENGIHYTNLDELWKIILEVSKSQNNQVFATTHSKECIESFHKILKQSDDNDDTTFIELGKDKKGNIKANLMENEQFNRNIEIGNGVRGW
jgi:AAA15 family ATPase/GTPase